MHLAESALVFGVLIFLGLTRMRGEWQMSLLSSSSPEVPGKHQKQEKRHGIFRATSQKQAIQPDYISPASIAFLFLTSGEEMNEALWKSWFRNAEDDRYSVFVHTRPLNNSTIIPNMPEFFCPHVISDSVESSWYHLHPAMMRLLEHAYTHSHATHFVFVSPTTIPLKSFHDVYEELTKDNKSRFCLTPTGQARSNWRNVNAQLHVSLKDVAKAELWSTIPRRHVRLILDHAQTLKQWNNAFIETSTGAPDESLLPTLIKKYARNEMHTCHGEIQKKNELPHGCCATYVKWDGKLNDTHYGIEPSVDDVPSHQQVNAPYFWNHQPCVMHHPCSYDVLHEEGLRELIQRPYYLFLRKVLPGTVVLTKNGEQIPLAEVLPRLHRGEPLFAGSGGGNAVDGEQTTAKTADGSSYVCRVHQGRP